MNDNPSLENNDLDSNINPSLSDDTGGVSNSERVPFTRILNSYFKSPLNLILFATFALLITLSLVYYDARIFSIESVIPKTLKKTEVEKGPINGSPESKQSCITEYVRKDSGFNLIGSSTLSGNNKRSLDFLLLGEYIAYANKTALSRFIDKDNVDSVIALDYSPANNSSAYITVDSNSDSDSTNLYSVILLDHNLDTEKVIYSVEYPKTTNVLPGYTLKLADVEFSDSGDMVAIVGSESLHIYNINEENITKMSEIKPDIEGGVYGYRNPRFSQNDKYLVITRGYWEGSNDVLYDLEQDRLIETGYSSYVSGQHVVGWSNNRIVVNDRDNRHYYLVSPTDLEDRTLLYDYSANPSQYSSRVVLETIVKGSLGNKLYLLDFNDVDDNDNLYCLGANPNEVLDKSEMVKMFYSVAELIEIDLETIEQKHILTLDVTRFDETGKYSVSYNADSDYTLKTLEGTNDDSLILDVKYMLQGLSGIKNGMYSYNAREDVWYVVE